MRGVVVMAFTLILVPLASHAQLPEPEVIPSLKLSVEACNLVEKSIAKGWTPDQVLFLARRPEFVQSFKGGLEVWRYGCPADFLLVAFQNGRVSEVARRSRVEQPVAPVPKTVAPTPTIKYYASIGQVFGLTLGEYEPYIRDRMREQGFVFTYDPNDTKSVLCTSDKRGTTMCDIRPGAGAPWGLNASDDHYESVGLLFTKSKRFVGVIHIIGAADPEVIRSKHVEYVRLFEDKFGSPPGKAMKGFGRIGGWGFRKLLSMSLGSPRLAASDGWSRGDVEANLLLYQGSVVIGTQGDLKFTVLVVVHSLKAMKE